jgi:hypothetical protein
MPPVLPEKYRATWAITELTLPQSAGFQQGWNVQSCDLSKELVVPDGPSVVDRLGHLPLVAVHLVAGRPTVLLAPAPPAEVAQTHFFARRHAGRSVPAVLSALRSLDIKLRRPTLQHERPRQARDGGAKHRAGQLLAIRAMADPDRRWIDLGLIGDVRNDRPGHF